MAHKLRSVNTRFWEDPFIEELTPSEKLLFLYFLTNPLTNLLGVYEITIKRISYDTGINKDAISKAFERFGTIKKAFYIDNYIILPNFLKNQNLNKNMKIAVARQFNDLPIELKNNILGNGSEGLGNDSEGFRMVMESLGKYEIEVETEKEDEEEGKKADIIYPIGFEKVITDWLEYKKEKGQTYKPKGLETFVVMLLKYSNNDPKKADEIIKFSMSNNYAGIFESKNKASVQNNSDTKTINYDTPL